MMGANSLGVRELDNAWIESPEALVSTLYRALLAREPDPEGLELHVQALRSNSFTPEAIAMAFIGSEEFRRRHGGPPAYAPVAAMDCAFVLPVGSDVAGELQSPEGYEPWALPYFLDCCRPGMRVLDIGASWGVFALPAARRVGPQGRVFALEVSPWNCQVLLKSIEASGLANVQVLPLGVSDRLGHELLPNQTFTNNNSLHTGRSARPDDLGDFTVVPVLPLDMIRADLGRIHVMKMDIEGMEYRASIGALSFLREQRPLLFCEYSPKFQQHGSGVDGAELLSLFLDLGYRLEILHRAAPREMIGPAPRGEQIARVDGAWRRHVEMDRGTHLDLCLHPAGAAD